MLLPIPCAFGAPPYQGGLCFRNYRDTLRATKLSVSAALICCSEAEIWDWELAMPEQRLR
ncbi:hypothetical protein XFF6166_490108 [Xanthomonas citri pv. fuscans]|uniref:Uncharacterized protein n=1 Tax=Xanthomonas campestris pv. phaseoli TaxID=317013 RepID=A0A7Z7NIF8_XANCH|nr:hypothetical protein XFF6166_490108 [Xanthomonas citri pv. fuscans]SOO26091.1 hypothetical protein XFF6991_520065 [Xanthomonas phaseoli pv. phaseoli]SON96129.1 hypothetical protein XFF6990_310021 [Xanthomonas citri pv. fuscans]SOO00942.1 hypothetical protein XFF7767_1080074 [Xanthomonas citri pv. fuscans]SOO01285.1 hypothetical protein XFF6960_460108 [Xanthomonas citri pv. fuscans]